MESPHVSRRARRGPLLAAALAALALAAAGCGALGYTSGDADKQNGKELFVKGANGKPSCGSCHILADAGTTGTIGPNLDAAFRQALKVGMTEGTIRQVVRGQIAYAIDQPSSGSPGMPKRLVTGDDARDVAAYVASAVVKDNSAAANAAAAPAAAPSPPAAGSSSGSGAGDATTAAGKKVFPTQVVASPATRSRTRARPERSDQIWTSWPQTPRRRGWHPPPTSSSRSSTRTPTSRRGSLRASCHRTSRPP